MFMVVFLVKFSFPVFHHSTDGFVGVRTRIEEAFGTYEEAVQYIADNHGDDPEDYDFGSAYITMDVTWDVDGKSYGHEYSMRDLHVNSHYTGVYADPWTEVPF